MERSIDEGYFHVSLECTLQASEGDLGWRQVKVHLQEEIHFKEAHHFKEETKQKMQLVDLKEVLTNTEE